MKKLRHKFLSVILSAALITAFIPSEGLTVFALDPSDVTTTGLNLSTSSVPLVETTYQAGEGTIVWSPTTKTVTGTEEVILSSGTITLNNATIDTSGDIAINLPEIPVAIVATGTNNNLKGNIFGIYNDTGITIQGTGTLNVEGGLCSIICLSDLTIMGGVTVNSSGCDYGIIVNNGKLTVDTSSKLITDANIAPFCVSDDCAATPKAQKDVISLPGLPIGTQITSVFMTNSGGQIYWSLIPTGGTLGLTTGGGSNLTGAAKGLLTFAYIPPVPDPTPTYTPDPHAKTATTENIADVAKNLTDGDKLTIKPTTDNKTVSGDVLKEIKGKNVEVKIEIADGIEWSFNGKDIPDGWDAKDINFNLDTANSQIPADILKAFTNGKQSKILSLDYDGAFGFAITLTVHIGYLNDGQYANIYYYNPETKTLEFKGSSKINGAGNAKFDFEHASDYVILVSDKTATSSDKVDMTTNDTTTTSDDEANPKTGETIPAVLVIASLAAVAIVTKKRVIKFNNK